MTPDKPFKTYTEQIGKLREHAIDLGGLDDELIIQQLQEYGYYNIANTYQNKFHQDKNERYTPSISLPLLLTLKQLDEQISGILLPVLLHIENTFETSLGYHIAEHFGVFAENHEGNLGYLAQKHYNLNSRPNPKPTLRKLKAMAKGKWWDGTPYRVKASSSLSSYRERHNHIPPWILLNDADFGTAETWYRCSPKNIKDQIAADMFGNEFPTNKDYLADCLNIIHSYRNTLAHGSSITKAYPRAGIPLDIVGSLNNSVIATAEEFKSKSGRPGINKKGIFAVLILAATMTKNYPGFITALTSIKNMYGTSGSNLTASHKLFSTVFGYPDNFDQRIDTLATYYTERSNK